MTIPTDRQTREQRSYLQSPTRAEGQTAQEVFVGNFGNFNPPEKADAITVQYPSTTQEIYEYREGGVSGSILASVTVQYLLPDKKDITSVVYS